jgi:excisionase family DNA binding protein
MAFSGTVQGERQLRMPTYRDVQSIKADELLTVKEVAEELRVDPTTVRRWIKNGSLEAISFPEKIGRQRQTHRIRRSVLESLLLAQQSD